MIEHYIIKQGSSANEIHLSIIFHLRREDVLVELLQDASVPEKSKRSADEDPERKWSEIRSEWKLMIVSEEKDGDA